MCLPDSFPTDATAKVSIISDMAIAWRAFLFTFFLIGAVKDKLLFQSLYIEEH